MIILTLASQNNRQWCCSGSGKLCRTACAGMHEVNSRGERQNIPTCRTSGEEFREGCTHGFFKQKFPFFRTSILVDLCLRGRGEDHRGARWERTSGRGLTGVSSFFLSRQGVIFAAKTGFLLDCLRLERGGLPDGLLVPEVPSGAEQGFLVIVIQ